MEFEELDHDGASLLLPWLGTDRLEQRELERLLDHLKRCDVCRRELRDLADLGRFAELSERQEAPDGPAIEQRLEGVLQRLDVAPEAPRPFSQPFSRGARRLSQAPLGRRLGLPLAALLVLALGFAYVFVPASPPAALYQTLSSPEATPAELALAEAAALRVVFADSCTQGELRGLLQRAAAEIRTGPSSHGVYTLSLSQSEGLEAQIAALRSEPCFVFVEKVAAAGNR